jgi:hypothetical protein
MPLSPCDYTPAESFLTQLSVQGSFQMYDDPYRDDRESTFTGVIQTDFSRLSDSERFGYRAEVKGRTALSPSGLDPQVTGSGSFKRYLQGDLFAVGVIDAQLAGQSPPSVNLTGGLGWGRFRDVTPLAKAIRIHDTLLDQGALLGPLDWETLRAMAQEIGRPGQSLGDTLAQIEQLIEAVGLAAGGDLGARALLQIEQILKAREEARLCGRELQASVGLELSSRDWPDLSEALALHGRYAQVPDPVSQWTVSAQWISGLVAPLERYSLQLTVSYGRRLRENWRVRGGYSFMRDRLRDADRPFDRHRLSAVMSFQVALNLSLTMQGEILYETGYEEPAERLTVQLSYDVF